MIVDLQSKQSVKSMTHRDGDRERARWTHRELVPFPKVVKWPLCLFGNNLVFLKVQGVRRALKNNDFHHEVGG